MTIALPNHFATLVPINTMFDCSAIGVLSGKVSLYLLTGLDSPVKAKSLVPNHLDSITLASAATDLPSSKSIRSPGTKSSTFISCCLPSLMTVA